MKIHVAGAQIRVSRDVQQNVAALCEVIQTASSADADILLTPEGSLSGYTHDFDSHAVADGLRQVTLVAREQGVGLALGTCFVESNGKCYNQLRFYRPDGAYLGFHSKMLRCGSLDTPSQGEINHYSASALRTFPWASGITIGGLICNDMWANPECTPMPDTHLSQRLSAMGARIIFHGVNGG